jgi:hypothetical protein
VTADLFTFLTTEPNALVAQYHPKTVRSNGTGRNRHLVKRSNAGGPSA